MRGFKSIWMGSVVDYDAICIDNYRKVIENYPEVAGMDYRPLYNNAMHTLTNGSIEVADDGKSRRLFSVRNRPPGRSVIYTDPARYPARNRSPP